ncbi:hypothetical protein FVEN_g2901 [Fusarium venenatum]|uniref:Uncharacterized protein n=1 Tax=Fusarium venenatum TaxID=56646 RepID=A0A2L2SY30_9HYPO|nr:uncharacterized protein FVRRES_06284 [Fusarium venenatum]KAG8359237.1 hypothetical protein FVEN_g2901 [Fusarium venenatum]KAH6993294.1 hypothetical protein EDB82DRAFT_524374 [Fusarium venenatum]CEI61848.1 unnamed protein product [Fusarium venenatum]
MSSLPPRFIIVVDGKHVAKPEQKGEEMFQAQSGDEPAIFELKGDRLVSGDYALGRWIVEDVSAQPKPIMWRKNEEESGDLRPVTVTDGAHGPEISFYDSTGIAIHEGKLFAVLAHGTERAQSVEIRASED